MSYEMVHPTTTEKPPANEESVGDALASGVHNISALLDETDNLVFRRFGALNTRVLLHLQRDIGIEEEKLRRIDAKLQRRMEEVGPREHASEEAKEEENERARLVESISAKLRAYNELFIQNTSMRQTPAATKRQVKLLKEIEESNGLAEDTYYNLDHGFDSDLVAVTPQRMSIMDSLLSRAITKMKPRRKTATAVDNLSTPSRSVTVISTLIIIIVGISMLITPLWLLTTTSNLWIRLGQITAFTFVVPPLLFIAMRATPWEILSSVVAYLAILVVFLGVPEGS